MEKVQMCRICVFVKGVHMFKVASKDLQELYEKLTDVPFVTEDHRPMLACYICYSELEQCHRLLSKCLRAEELFTQMVLKDCEPNRGQLDICNGFKQTPIENISIHGVGQTEIIAIKAEPPAGGRLDDVTDPKEDHLSEEQEPKHLEIYVKVEEIPPHQSDSEDDVPLMEFKTDVEEEQEVSVEQRRASESESGTVARKSHLDTGKVKQGITLAQKKLGAKLKKIPNKQNNKDDATNLSTAGDTNRLSNVRDISVCKEIPFQCDICQRCFKCKRNLNDHLHLHTQEKPFKCDICERCFSHRSNLGYHKRTHFVREKPFECDICQRAFSYKSLHDSHKRTHNGDKPFKCDICERRFNRLSNLKAHSRTHTLEKAVKRFKCDICQRCFRFQSSLKYHKRTHSGIEIDTRFECDICQRGFFFKSKLDSHRRTHTGERPFKCDVCHKTFTRNTYLQVHRAKHTDIV